MAGSSKVLWAELFPWEFKARLEACPVVYMPWGLCEPHGQISAYGLDTFKAEHICLEAARKIGGIVAPTMGYHIHETGPSAKFLEQQVGNANPAMTSIPSPAMLHFFLYQLRAFHNAGFRAAIVLSGHGGSNVKDVRTIAACFEKHTGMRSVYITDFDLAGTEYPGDHAGKYEISVLQYLRPELIDFAHLQHESMAIMGGRYALHASAKDASPAYGKQIMDACVRRLAESIGSMSATSLQPAFDAFLSIKDTEAIWQDIVEAGGPWTTLQPAAGQQPVSPGSRWKSGETISLS